MQKRLEKLSQKAARILKYAVSALILAVPLYPKFPFIRLPQTAVSIRLEDFLVFAVLVVWFIAVLPKLKSILKNKITQSVILFLVVALVSLIFGIMITKTVIPHVGILHWVRRVEYLSVFFIGLYSIKSMKDLYFYIRVLFVVIPVVFIYGVGQRYFNLPVITTQNQEYARGIALRWMPGSHLVSTFAGHYDMASFLILLFPSLYLFLFAKRDTIKSLFPGTPVVLSYITMLILVLMSLWLLMQAASRISIVSYLGTSCLALLLMNRKKFIPLVIVVSIVFAAFSSNLIDRYLNIVNVYAQGEVVETAPVEDRSTSIRINVEWPRAIRALNKNPITGLGYSSITLATDNDYLRMLGETGIFGFLAFILVLGNIVLEMFKKFPKPGSVLAEDLFLAGIFAAIPGILLNMVFIDILEASKFAIVFWLVMGFGVYIAINKKNG